MNRTRSQGAAEVLPARRSWAREPLLHFTLLGAALFAIHTWRSGGSAAEEARTRPVIEVSAGTLQSLTDRWARQYNRWPTPEEARGLIDEHVREEVLYREALALGLERDDAIVRRRLAQKMEFLLEDVATPADPDAATLERWFEQNKERYAPPAAVSLRHVYFSRERRGESASGAARAALEQLRAPGASDEELGDPFLLGASVEGWSEREISDVFGPELAKAAATAPLATWLGPFESPYGLHLVHLSARADRTPPLLPEVREAVLRDFRDEHRRQVNRKVLDRLRDRYRLDVAVPPAAPPPASGPAK